MEYKGKLKGFPTEVVDKMLERQVEQGNRRDVSVFEKNRMICSGGFEWASSPEGHSFWEDVIKFENFDTFFAKYPKKTYPKVMMVSSDGEFWQKRVVIAHKCGKYIAWSNARTIEDADIAIFTTTWGYAKEVDSEPEPMELTIDEIAEKFGVDPKQIKIKK